MSRTRTVLLISLALVLWSGVLHLRATLDPPVGTRFAGTFHWIDDFYNYLSYAQQASDGSLLLRNKLAPPAPARLFNLEWWVVGRASRWLDGRPFLAYDLFGALATTALVAGAERWLSRLAVGLPQRAAALALVASGGGLGGLLFGLTDLPVRRCVDLSVAVFPFLEVVGNPHFVAGTALLLWSLWFFSEVPAPRGPLLGVLTGSALAVVRPYDVGLLVAMRLAAVLALERPARWLRTLAPLLGLVPAIAYDAWVFFGSSQFSTFRRGGAFPGRLECAAALGPALLIAATEWLRPASGAAHARARVVLWAWSGVCLLVLAVKPGGFTLQLAVGGGLPLLMLGGAALSRLETRLAALVALCFASSAVVETRILLQDDPNWYVPAPRLAAAETLRALCRPGDRVLAPPDIGLYTIGLTACDAFVAHPAGPGYDDRVGLTRAFYSSMPPAARQTFLDRESVDFLVLPGWPGPVPSGWLGPATPFRAVRAVGNPLRPTLSIYARGRVSAALPGGAIMRPL